MKGSRAAGENLFFARKITNDPKCSQFFEICAGVELFSIMLLQGILSQDMEGIRPFLSFLCLGQPSLEHLHFCLAYVHPHPIVIFHVPEQVLILVGLGQKSLQMRHLTGVFPFRFLRNEYAPLMRLIMRYFTCEGRFSRVYSYHIRLLMHFTRVRMMKILVFLCQNIERMVPLMQRKSPAQQYRSLYHYGLIQLVVIHQLVQHDIPWEEFISREFFTAPPPHPEIVHEEGGPSQ